MPIKRTYHEFEANDGSTWFIEQRCIDATTIHIRQGQVGTQGATQTLKFDTPLEAEEYLHSHNKAISPQPTVKPITAKSPVSKPLVSHPAVDTRSLYANFGQRVLAFVIDKTILTALWLGCFAAYLALNDALLLKNNNLPMIPPIELLFFVIWALYSTLFNASDWQATPGKKILGLIVTNNEGEKLTLLQSAKRWVLQALDYTLTLSIGLLAAAFTRKSQTLHDILADTLVYDKRGYDELQNNLHSTAEKQIIQCAQRHQGIVTALLIAGETELSLQEANKTLQSMALAAICRIEINDNGAIEYHFIDFMR